MFPKSLYSKNLQISQQALPPIHGNEIFILSQQDVRKIEDSRLFIMSKVLPNGSLKIINSLDATDCLQQLSQWEGCQYQQLLHSLVEFLSAAVQQSAPQQQPVLNQPSCPEPMDVSMPANNVASISQQLQWQEYKNNSTPFPMHYSHGTSTTELENNASCACNNCKICSHCVKRLRYSDKSTSVQDVQNACNEKPNEVLDAREQLKKKKILYALT